MPANEQLNDLDFPLGGLNLLTEFQEQLPGTTPDCENVRGINPDSLRERGGSRAMLARYCPSAIPADLTQSMVIQHLAMIVDPQAAALRNNFTVPGDDWVEDPLNPGYFVPPGGWGNPPSPRTTPATVAHVQSKRTKFNGVTGTQSAAFTSSVTFNNTLIVFVASQVDGTSGSGVMVTNGASTAYTQVGSYIEILDPRSVSNYLRLSCWKKTANSGVDDNTVKVSLSDVVIVMAVTQLEYSGMPTSGQTDSTTTNSDLSLSPTPPATTGNVAVLGDNELILGAFATIFDASSFTPGAGFTIRPSVDDGTDFDLRLNVVEKTGLQNPANNPTAATGTTSGGEDPYVAIGATFKAA